MEQFKRLMGEQLPFLLKCTLAGAVITFLLTLPFYGFTPEIPLGLALGILGSLVNMLLLGWSTVHAVDKGEKGGRRYMLMFYLLRLLIMGGVLWIGYNVSFINFPCTFIPLLFPKAGYTLLGIRDELRHRMKK